MSIKGSKQPPPFTQSPKVNFFDMVWTAQYGGEATTALLHLRGFYKEVLAEAPKRPVVEAIAAAPSPFAVEMILRDLERLMPRPVFERKKAEWRRAAIVRLHELKGWIYVEGADEP